MQGAVNQRPLISNGIIGKQTIGFYSTNYLSLQSTLLTNVVEVEAFVLLKAESATPTSTRGLWYLSQNGSYYPDTDGSISDGVGSLNLYHTPVAPIALNQPHISRTEFALTIVSRAWTRWLAPMEANSDSIEMRSGASDSKNTQEIWDKMQKNLSRG